MYHFFDDPIALERVVAEVEPLEAGGTLAANLARHALQRGYAATIYTYNLRAFDPTWFDRSDVDLSERLRLAARVKLWGRLREATRAYLDFLARRRASRAGPNALLRAPAERRSAEGPRGRCRGSRPPHGRRGTRACGGTPFVSARERRRLPTGTRRSGRGAPPDHPTGERKDVAHVARTQPGVDTRRVAQAPGRCAGYTPPLGERL